MHYKASSANSHSGFSLLEVLVVIAIFGLFASLTMVSAARVMKNQDELASVSIIKQSLTSATSAASSRGKTLDLMVQGTNLILQEHISGNKVRQFDLPKQTSLNVSDGLFVQITSAGRIEPSSLAALPSSLELSVKGVKYALSISLIGELKAEPK